MLRKKKKGSGTDIYNAGNYEDSYCDDYDPFEELYEDAPRKDLQDESPDGSDGGNSYKDSGVCDVYTDMDDNEDIYNTDDSHGHDSGRNEEYRDEDYGDESYEDDDFLSDLDDDEIDKLAELDDGDGFDDFDDIDGPDYPDDSDNSDSFNDSEDGLTATGKARKAIKRKRKSKPHRTAKDNEKSNIARIANESTGNTAIDNTRASSPSRSLSSAPRQHRKHEMHYSKKKEKQINRLFIAMLSLFIAGIPAMSLYIVTKANSIHSAITFVPSEHVADNAFQYWIGFFGCAAMITSLVAMLTMMLTDNVPKLFRPFLYSSVFGRRSAASSRETEENDGSNPDEEDPSNELSKKNKEVATNNPDKLDELNELHEAQSPKNTEISNVNKAKEPRTDTAKPAKLTEVKIVTDNASNAANTSTNAEAAEDPHENTGKGAIQTRGDEKSNGVIRDIKPTGITEAPRAEISARPTPSWVKQLPSDKKLPAWAQLKTGSYF